MEQLLLKDYSDSDVDYDEEYNNLSDKTDYNDVFMFKCIFDYTNDNSASTLLLTAIQNLSNANNKPEIGLLLSIFQAINNQPIGFNKLVIGKDERDFIDHFLNHFEPIPQSQQSNVQIVTDVPYNPLGELNDED